MAIRPSALAPDQAMIERQRGFHRAIWALLALLVFFGVTMALVLRPPPEPPAVGEPK
jgi:hypothetical protein